MRDCMVEAMDAQGLFELLTDLKSGAITTVCRDTPEPSVLSHEIS